MASSTYLTLVNKVLRRVNEVELTASNFADARGIHASAKEGVLRTVRRINTKKIQWPFNQVTGSQLLVVGQELYTWPALWKDVDWGSFYIEKDDTLGTNTHELKKADQDVYYKTLKPRDLDSDTDGRGKPDYVFESNAGGFGVTPSPDQAYTVKFFYSTNDIVLDAYTDSVTMPDLYDELIIDGAMYTIYMHYDNVDRANEAENAFKDQLNEMAINLIPKSDSVIVRQVNTGGGSQYSRSSMSGYLAG